MRLEALKINQLLNTFRYLIYLQRNRNSRVMAANEPDLNTQDLFESEAQGLDIGEDEEIPSLVRGRRGTLSPRSAKQMMLEVIDDDSDDTIHTTDDSASFGAPDSVGMEKGSVESTISPEEASGTKTSSLDGEPIVVAASELGDSKTLTSIEVLAPKTSESNSSQDSTASVDNEDSQSVSLPSLPMSDCFPISPGSELREGVNELEKSSAELTAAGAEERARERYMFRMQQAEWRYLWEIASWEAAELAAKIKSRG